jgi:Domain of unknown function (DUF4249)
MKSINSNKQAIYLPYFQSLIFSVKIIVAFLVLVSVGCIDEINYNVSTEKDRIVISGLITSKEELQTIQVRRSVLTGAGNLVNSTPIDNATVTIVGNNTRYALQNNRDGSYTATFRAISGISYTLEVKVGDQVYKSTPQTMPQPLPMLDANTALNQTQFINASGNVVNEKKVAVELSGAINNQFSALYRVLGKYEFMEFNPPSTTLKTCFVDEEIDNNTIKLINANDLRTNTLENYNLLEIPFDARFFRMYAFTIRQFAISESSLSYWKKVNQVTKAGENLFDSPPGRILGNIKNENNKVEEVLGNFTLGNVSEQTVYTNMTRLGNVTTDPCLVRFNTARPGICLDCLKIPNSTTTRPANWPF